MNKFYKIGTTLLTSIAISPIVLSSTSLTQVSANNNTQNQQNIQSNNQQTNTLNINNEQSYQNNNETSQGINDSYSQYINFNTNDSRYELNNNASSLPQTISNDINAQINKVNDNIKVASLNQNIKVADPQTNLTYTIENGKTINNTNNNNSMINTMLSSSGYGKNDVVFHWNYARIYLDKKTVNSLIKARHASETYIGGTLIGTLGAAVSNGIGGVAIGAIGAGIIQFTISEYGMEFVQTGRYYDFSYSKLEIDKAGNQ